MTPALSAGLSGAAVMLLTAAHHAYGAARFDTPWRYHVVHLSLWVIGAIAVLIAVHILSSSTVLRRATLLLGVLLLLAVPVALIGLFEGGYNHVIKNLLYFAGLSRHSFDQLFPPPTYEPPSDWPFELSGVLQLPIALIAAGHAVRWWKVEWRRAERGGRW